MPVEHGIALVSSVPGVEGVVRENQTDAIPNVLLLVVLYLHELVSEVVVVQELIVVVSQNQMLLSPQRLQQPNRGLRVVAGDVPKDEHMVFRLHYPIPVVQDSVVIVLLTIQLVVRKGQFILCPPNWICVSLIAKVNVRNVEVVYHAIVSFMVFTIYRPSLSRIQPEMQGNHMQRNRMSMETRTNISYCQNID